MTRPRIGSLCSGAGMLDEGVRAVLGGEATWHAETDPAASRVLAHRYPGVPNLGDLTTVDWSHVPPVDVLTAGYPCQPDSAAGLRLSEDDHRWIFPDIARAIGVLRPRLVVLENVQGHFVRGFRTVLGALTTLGFDADWTLVRASDVGAPHRRERLFVAAWPTDANGAGPQGREPARRHDMPAGGIGGDDADATGDGWDEGWPESAGIVWGSDAAVVRGTPADANRSALRDEPVREQLRSGGAPVAGHARRATSDTGRGGRDRRAPHPLRFPRGRVATPWRSCRPWCEVGRDWRAGDDDYAPAIRRWHDLTRCVPSPVSIGIRGGVQLAAAFDEWLMGWPAGWVTDVPGVTRNDALRICGNGVVPQQAEAAVRFLLAHLAERAA